MSFLSQHKLIIIIGVLVIAGGMWFTLSGSTPSTPDLVTTGSASPADQTLVTTLLALRAVKLDGTILNNPAFMSLKDFSTDIVPEPVGRENPFAPLSRSASASASTTKSAQIFTPHR